MSIKILPFLHFNFHLLPYVFKANVKRIVTILIGILPSAIELVLRLIRPEDFTEASGITS